MASKAETSVSISYDQTQKTMDTYEEKRTEILITDRGRKCVKRWSSSHQPEIFRDREREYVMLLTHCSEEGQWYDGEEYVEPRQLMNQLAEEYGVPSQDVWVLCCHPGKVDDFEYGDVTVRTLRDWECESTLQLEMGYVPILQYYPDR